MTFTRRPLALLAILLPLAGCGGSEPGADPQQPSAVPTPIAQAQAGRKERAAAAEAEASAAQPAAASGEHHPALLDPSLATEQAPDSYTVRLETTQGEVLIDVDRSWSPNGADRFYNLVKIGFYEEVPFFRVIAGFMAQVGINGDPAVNAAWRPARIQDDPVIRSNTRGMVTFAKSSAPDSRTVQIFFSFKDNSNLDAMGFSPFGEVRSMKPIDKLYSGYGECQPRGQGPNQGSAQMQGMSYFKGEFPNLDYIVSASIVEG